MQHFIYFAGKLANEFDNLQDVHSGVWQLAITSNTTCGLWLDCVSTAFVASVTFSFIILYESKSPISDCRWNVSFMTN